MESNKRIKSSWDEIKDAIVNGDLERALPLLKTAVDSRKGEGSPADGKIDPVLVDPPPRSNILCKLMERLNHTNSDDVYQALICLLKLGCNPADQDINWRTPMHFLTRNDDYMVNFSVFNQALRHYMDSSERDAYLNTEDALGKSAMYYAANRRDAGSVVLELLDDYANPFVGDRTYSHVLRGVLRSLSDMADEEETFEAVGKLLDLGSRPMGRDRQGKTALHILCENHHGLHFHGFVDMLSVHVRQPGRLINATDRNGKTALDYAMRCQDAVDKVETLLLIFRPDPFKGDPTGSSILDAILHHLDTNNDATTAFALLQKIGHSVTFLFLRRMAIAGRLRTG